MNNYIILTPVFISQVSDAIFAVSCIIPPLADKENLIPFVDATKSGEATSVQVISFDWFQTDIIIPDLILLVPDPTPKTQ